MPKGRTKWSTQIYSSNSARLRAILTLSSYASILLITFSILRVVGQPPPYLTTIIDSISCSSPDSIAVYNGIVMASCDGGVVALSGSSLKTIVSTDVCNIPTSMAVVPQTGDVLVGCDSHGILRYNGTSTVTIATGDQCANPTIIAVSDLHQIAVIACTSYVTRIDLVSGAVDKILNDPQCGTISEVISYFEDETEYMIASCLDSPASLVRLNVNTRELEILANSSQCMSASAVSRDPNTGLVYLATTNGIFRIQSSTNVTLLTDAFASFLVSRLQYDPFTQAVVINYDGGVVAVNSDGMVVRLATYAQCMRAKGLVIVDGYYYLGCLGGVAKLSSESQSIVLSFLDCPGPGDIVMDQITNTLYTDCPNGIASYSHNSFSLVVNKTQCFDAGAIVRNPITGLLTTFCSHRGLTTVNVTSGLTTTLNTQYLGEHQYDLAQDYTTGEYFYSCDLGVVKFDPKTGESRVIINATSYGNVDSIVHDVPSNTWYFATDEEGVLKMLPDGSIDVVANYSVCGGAMAGGVVAYDGNVIMTCATDPQNVSPSVILMRGNNITTMVTSAVCSTPSAIWRNDVSGVILVTCGENSDDVVIAIDSTTHQVKRIIGRDACVSAIRAYQDELFNTYYISCDQGLTAVTTDFRCYGGTYWNAGSCVLCDPHTYRSVLNPLPMGRCLPCPPGFTAPQAGSVECTSCPPGRYESNNLCLLCEQGTYQPQLNATTCIQCDVGSHAMLPGSSHCALCDAGSYSSTNGSVSCLPCNSGSASNITGLTHPCDGCPAGSYQASIGQVSCLTCPPSFYSEQANSTSCTRCANQVNPEHTTCTIITCDADYQFNDATNLCEPCSLSQYSSRGGKCTTCVTKTYTPGEGSGCAPCDGIDGLECSNGIATVAAGYWAYLSSDATWSDPAANPLNRKMYALYQTSPCPFCQGSVLQLSNASSESSGVQYCTFPRLNSPNNTLCAQCEPGYMAWADSCVTCEKANAGLFIGGFVLSFAFVLFLYQSGSPSSAGSLSIFLFFIQTAALELGPITKWLDWIQVLNLNSKSTSNCLAPWDAYDQTLFSLLVPLILTAELALLALIHYTLHRGCRSSNAAEDDDSQNYMVQSSSLSTLRDKVSKRLEKFSLQDYRVAFISILLFCYTQVANTSMRFLHCVEVADQRLNFSAPTIDCRSSRYNTYLIPTSLALGVYVIAFPIAAWVMLWRKKEVLYLDVDDPSLQHSPATLNFLYHWSPLYRMYHPRAYFWQCWVLVRRCGFVVASVLLMQNSAVRYLSFNLMHLASLMLHMYISPYHDEILNRIETGSYVILICMSAALGAYTPPYSTPFQAVLFVLVGPTAIGMMAFVLYQRYQQVSEWFSKRAKNRQISEGEVLSGRNLPHKLESMDNSVEIPSIFRGNSLHEPMISRIDDRHSDL